jgi:anti-sigma factor RsiW
VPDLSAAGLTYAGGRMLVIDQAPVADFLYARRNGPPIALCVARTGAAASPLAVDERHSLRIAHWSRDGNTYLLVGAMDAATARRIADLAAPQV